MENIEKYRHLNSYLKNKFGERTLKFSNDNTGKLICRDYNSADFTNAVLLLNKYNIDVVVHIMVGLPGENFDDIKKTVKFLNNHSIQGLKIHSKERGLFQGMDYTTTNNNS